MTPERWRQIEELLDSALRLDAADRDDFLLSACAGDEELLQEVQSLLACDGHADGLWEAPARCMQAGLDLSGGEQLGPYRVVAPVGAGGMGEVYSAEDTRLGRMVALKLLPRQLADSASALKRFRREARSASKLSHPNICTIYDVGEYQGQPFLVMELLEGRSLKDRLRDGAMTADEVVAIGTQIAAALDAAHAKGVVHRDIKPANVFLTSSGEAKVLDFGVAKTVQEPGAVQESVGVATAAEPVDATLSVPGCTPGTMAYMSPEQARGEPVDGRTDLFSLGVTLYEMATGTRPFRGKSAADLVDALLTCNPVRPRKLNPAISPDLERVVLKALAKDKSARYQSAREIRTALQSLQTGGHRAGRRMAVLAVCVVALGVFVSIRSAKPPVAAGTTPASAEVTRVAVLPLKTGSQDTSEQVLARGIADAIAGDLASLRALRVISASSTAGYHATDKSVAEIARELRADIVVQGSVQMSGRYADVTLRLARPDSEAPVWAERFVATSSVTRAMRAGVARAIARQVGIGLSPQDEARLTNQGTTSREAFEHYLRARYYWSKRTPEDIERAVGLFKQAIDADPVYAAAYAGLADCYNQFATVAMGQPPQENRALAIAAAARAIEIDDQNAEGHGALGFAKLYNWEWDEAESELTRALDLNPSYASAHIWRASSLLIRRHFDEAIAEADLAGELDPLSPITQTQVGWIRAHAGRTEEAIAQFRKVLATNPDYQWAMWQLGGNLMEAGRVREAIEVLERVSVVSGNSPTFLGALGMAYAEAGRRAEAKEILSRLRAMSRERYVTPHAPAHVCLALGDLDCFFRELEEGYRQRINYVAYLSVTPTGRHSGVRTDPRFQDLLRRLNYKVD